MKVYILIAAGVLLLLLVVLRKRLAPYFRFLFTPMFLINFFCAIIVAGLAFWGLLAYLDNYTLHGENIAVPNFYGIHVNDLDSFSKEKNLRYMINDSVYSDELPKGTVVKQDPIAHTEETESFVKPNRTIYLMVVRSGVEYKTMPKVKDLSKDFAISSLMINGLTYAIKPVPGEYRDLVYGAYYKGKEIKEGEKIPKGSEILLHVGRGTGGDRTGVPNLICNTIEEARESLSGYSLFLDFHCDDCKTAMDSLNAKIYKQVPGAVSLGNSLVREGSELTVFASVVYECEKQVPVQDSTSMQPNTP